MISTKTTIADEKYVTPQGEEVTITRRTNKLTAGGTGIFEVKKYYPTNEWLFIYEELTASQLHNWGERELIAGAIIECDASTLTEDTLAHWLVVENPNGSEGYYPLPKLIDEHPLLAGDLLAKLV